nr:hypothetical protein [Saprospiraceae bacterium]
MLSILNLDKNTDVSRLDQLNQINGVCDSLKYRAEKIKKTDIENIGYSNNRLPDDECDRLVVIRDAMLDECDNYLFGLKHACKGSVTIAFWYHWNDKDCHK